MKILVIGATGVAGRNVIPQLISNKHRVTAMVRNQKDEKKFSQIADKVVIGDILDIKSLNNAMRDCECVLNLATAIPDWEQTDKIRNKGTQNLVKIALKYSIKIIQQSIVFLYGNQNDEIIDETKEIKPFALIDSAANMEKSIITSGVEYIILRGGTFYGKGTGTEEGWYDLAKNNNLKISDKKFAYNSLINVFDYARACVKAVESSYSKVIYNVVDDCSVDDKELYDYINNLFDNPKSRTGGERFLPSLRVSNQKIKKELDWKPIYSSYKFYLTI